MEMYKSGVVDGRMRERADWREILMNMITRESRRGRDAVGMLVTWGVRQAEAEGVLAYLEASLLGKVNFPSNG
jgi:hypothetical protein